LKDGLVGLSVHSFVLDDMHIDNDSDNDYENNQQDALYRLIYYSKSALHVSDDVFAHHQEHLTVFTVSGSVHPSCCRQQILLNVGSKTLILNTIYKLICEPPLTTSKGRGTIHSTKVPALNY
jgi:hypothetical protein